MARRFDAALIAIYSGFLYFYGGLIPVTPLSREEAAAWHTTIARLEGETMADRVLVSALVPYLWMLPCCNGMARMQPFLEKDDGGEFFMFNLIAYNSQVRARCVYGQLFYPTRVYGQLFYPTRNARSAPERFACVSA